MDDQEPSWPRQLMIGLGVLLVIGALVGSIVAVVAVKAADYVGVGDKAGTTSPAPVLPTTGSITQSPTSPQGPTRSSPPSSSKPPPPHHGITLHVSPKQAGSYDKVTLTGTYPGHDGATLQVQRSVGNGAWSDFPTTTHVTGGTFDTYIQTGMVGLNRLRMVDSASGAKSNVATVTIG